MKKQRLFQKMYNKSLDINPNSNADYIVDICKNNRKIIQMICLITFYAQKF